MRSIEPRTSRLWREILGSVLPHRAGMTVQDN